VVVEHEASQLILINLAGNFDMLKILEKELIILKVKVILAGLFLLVVFVLSVIALSAM